MAKLSIVTLKITNPYKAIVVYASFTLEQDPGMNASYSTLVHAFHMKRHKMHKFIYAMQDSI
jgi:hypothetical protein